MTNLSEILGTCTIAFKQRVANLIKFGNKGRLLMVRKNETLKNDFRVTEFKSAILELDNSYSSSLYSEIEEIDKRSKAIKQNVQDLETKIKQALKYSPTKLILFEYKNTLAGVVEEVKKLKFDWIFSSEETDQDSVVYYAKENEVFGLVYNKTADSKWVVSVNNPSATLADGVTINDSSDITGLDLLPIVAGLCAGCPYDMSVTGYTLSELESVEMPEIAKGQLTLYNEEEGVRVASPVNTLMTLNTNDTEDMKDICIMEGIKRFDTDVKYSFRTGYKGKYKNKYDNQQLFISACKGYIKDLVKADILDDEYENTVAIDTNRLRELWIASGKDEDEMNAMSDLEVSKLAYKKVMALKFDVKFLNAIESCEIEVEMY